MAQIFSASADAWFRLMGGAALISVGVFLGILALTAIMPTSFGSARGIPREQPVPFSHRHHVGELGLDCANCHTTADSAARAGLPTAQTCLACHSHVWPEAGVLEPVRQSAMGGEPLRWQFVNALPDFVYFHHGVHTSAGVECSACHGDIEEMPRTQRARTLTMRFCLSCHEAPAEAMADQAVTDTLLVAHAGIPRRRIDNPQDLTSCNVCHR